MAAVGGTVFVAGIILIPLPGPGLVVTPIGLAILATEFRWAKRALRRFKTKMGMVVEKPAEAERVPLDRIPDAP